MRRALKKKSVYTQLWLYIYTALPHPPRYRFHSYLNSFCFSSRTGGKSGRRREGDWREGSWQKKKFFLHMLNCCSSILVSGGPLLRPYLSGEIACMLKKRRVKSPISSRFMDFSTHTSGRKMQKRDNVFVARESQWASRKVAPHSVTQCPFALGFFNGEIEF